MKTVEECIKARDDYLIEHPYMQITQDKIDATLALIDNPIERCQIITELMRISSNLMTNEIFELAQLVEKADFPKLLLELAEEFRRKESSNNTK